jgi:FkbM family methyltransferase
MHEKLICEFQDYLNRFAKESSVSIFGASGYGDNVLAACKTNRVRVNQFYDNNKDLHGVIKNGIFINDPQKLSLSKESLIIASIWLEEILDQLKNELIFQGKKYIVDPWCDIFSSDFDEKDHEILSFLFKKVSDEESLSILKAIIEIRMALKGGFAISKYGQYFHPNIPILDGSVIIDGGACTGDTVQLLSNRTDLKDLRIHSFEPDEVNFNHLKQAAHKSNHEVHPVKKGLYSESTVLKFLSSSQTQHYECKIIEDGNIEIETISIDEYCRTEDVIPDFIKMDIEGVEKEAIIGAKETIRKYQPNLAICIYHKYNDLWKIPYMINQFYSNYEFHVGHHSNNWTETVLYAKRIK